MFESVLEGYLEIFFYNKDNTNVLIFDGFIAIINY